MHTSRCRSSPRRGPRSQSSLKRDADAGGPRRTHLRAHVQAEADRVVAERDEQRLRDIRDRGPLRGWMYHLHLALGAV
eukprot:7376635-Prymnesium_polylepis.1